MSFICIPHRFTPDFTLNRVTRELEVVAYTGETLSFTLIATLPPTMLAPCAAALPPALTGRSRSTCYRYVSWRCYSWSSWLCLYLEMVRYLEPATPSKPKLSPEDQAEMNSFKPFDLKNIAGIKSGPGSGDGGGGDRGSDGGGGGGGGGNNNKKSR